jgi:hypothetical protein
MTERHPFQIAYAEAWAECEAWFARNAGTAAAAVLRRYAMTVFDCRGLIRRIEAGEFA